MKRKDIELKRLEWRDKRDPKHLVYATLTWRPTDRVNGFPARYTAFLNHVWREGVCDARPGVVWEVGNPMETVSRTLVTLPKGARRSRVVDDDALGKFAVFLMDHLAAYLERYGIGTDIDEPALCAP